MLHDRSRRRFLRSLGAAALATTAARAAPAGNVYRWGSSSLGSSGYVIMEAFAQTANQHTAYRNASLATAGTAENLYLIGERKLEFAHSTSVDWSAALAGRTPYRRKVRASQLFAYATWQQVPLVRSDAGMSRLADLAGRRFSPSQPGSGTAALYNVLLDVAGLADAVRWRYGSWSEVYTAFRANQVDCVVGVFTNARPSGGIRQLEATLALRPLPIPGVVFDGARERNPGIREGRLDPADWPALDAPLAVPAITGIVACSPDVPDDVGYAITRAILDRAVAVRAIGAPLAGLLPDEAVSGLLTMAPVHPGAARYFRERGLWRDALTVGG